MNTNIQSTGNVITAKVINVFLISIILLLNTANLFSQQLPSSIANKYRNTIDWSISDSFNNDNINLNKWTYVKVYGKSIATSEYAFIPKGKGYLSINAKRSSKRGGGISTKQARQYGFYTFKWRAYGFNASNATGWIPAVWGAGQNFGKEVRRINPFPNKRLELDAIEIYGHNGRTQWRAQSIAWTGFHPNNTLVEQRLIAGKTDFTNWKIHGLEYHPNYVRLWQKNNGTWRQIKTVWFVNNSTNANRINKTHNNKLYWILWNVLHNKSNNLNDSALHVDYFYYFPYKQTNSNVSNNNLENTVDYSESLGVLKSNEDIISSNITSVKSFPNPSYGSSISIDYNIVAEGNVNLIVFDTNGKLISTLVSNEFLKTGNYSNNIETSKFPKPGVYYCRLETNKGVETHKIIISK
ncbi:hypothetical protein FHR24_001871 [Wenyingzhuangia heitensis]|uniref:GH16 domain-containing protein n=1 Tax=Wenyingzhuangia heitensis TaxID=1487859 RepID=A0ABX0U992_9FLAO|nr:T9SS type A sorting domain-containing protein [Wenyingzhuangia heitensis]NIJ45403.1 hypothetical protein [Wenyingzhuangia heitensis]